MTAIDIKEIAAGLMQNSTLKELNLMVITAFKHLFYIVAHRNGAGEQCKPRWRNRIGTGLGSESVANIFELECLMPFFFILCFVHHKKSCVIFPLEPRPLPTALL